MPLACVKLLIQQNYQVLIYRAPHSEFFQSICTSGIALTHVQHLALGLLNLIRFTRAHFLNFMSLWDIPSSFYIPCIAQFSVISKLAEGALNLPMPLLKMLQRTSPKIDPSGCSYPTNSYPLNILSFKSIHFQVRDKDGVWDHIKDLTEIQVDDISCSSFFC